MIDVDLVIATDDTAAINAAMDRLGWRDLPGVVDVDVMDRGFGDPVYQRMGGLLVDDTTVDIGDRDVYEHSLAAQLSTELGVPVATGRNYDAGHVPDPQLHKTA